MKGGRIQVQCKLVRQGGQIKRSWTIVSWFGKTNHCKTQFRTASTTQSRRWRRRLRPLPWSWDSDSELDGPVLTPHATTEVCHDTHINVLSGEPLVRPNIGRDVFARTQVSGTCNAESRHVRSTQDRVLSDDRQMLETMQPGTSIWRDQDSIDDNGVDATVPATLGALRAAGVTEFAPPTPVRRFAHNRFFSLADHD